MYAYHCSVCRRRHRAVHRREFGEWLLRGVWLVGFVVGLVILSPYRLYLLLKRNR